MHSSSKPHAFSSPITTPRSSGFTDSQNPGSPRSLTGQTTPLSPSMQSRLDTPLKMGDFYSIDSSFKSLSDALESGAKGAKFVPEARLVELAESIQTSTRNAQEDYRRGKYYGCHLNLVTAKSAQVSMLSIIDDTPVKKMPAAKRTALHDSCCALGSALTPMMLKAKKQVDDAKKEKEKETDQRDDDQGQPLSPPSSPVRAAGSRHVDTVSTAHGSKKRAQGDAHSPVLQQSTSKRRKTATSPAESSASATSSIASSTTSTTPTTALLQSPPSYRPAPQLVVSQTTASASASTVALGASPDTGAPASPATNPSPPKKRTLAPQARPRPPSQLFTAPPDFSRETAASVKPTDVASSMAALAPEPGAKPADKVHRPQTDASGLNQRY